MDIYSIPSARGQVRFYDIKDMSRRFGVVMQRMLLSLDSYKKPEDFVFSFQQSDVGTFALGDFISLLKEKEYAVASHGDTFIVTIPRGVIREARE